MDQGLLPRRYAKAMYKFAVEKNYSNRAYELMQKLVVAFETNPSLSQVLANPFVDNGKKSQLLFTACDANPDSDQPLADFFKLLEKNRRVDLTQQIALAYCSIYRKENNIYRVEVVSAAPLTAQDTSRVKNMIEKHLAGAKAEYSFSVDPGIIGGFVVTIDSQRLDASIKNQLKQLRLNLLSK